MRLDKPNPRIRTSCLALLVAVAGCSSSVVVETDFPVPLIEALPVRMGLLFEPELRNFIHAEALPQQSTWTIDLGDANLAMLEPLFNTMFAETRDVNAVPPNAGTSDGIDGVLRSTLEKFEFDVPIGERDDFVEVWMQYRLFLYALDGEIVADWPVTGYGKSELARNKEEAVRRAAVVAMREAGATISTQFAQQPQVTYWLQERQDAAGLSVDTRLTN